MKPIKHLRWWIVWTLFGSTVINYVSRMTISLLSQIIIPEFHLTYAQYGAIGSFFSYAYAVTWLVGGIILDRVGPRIGLTVAVIWWSVVNIVTSAASSLLALQILRSLFGVGEGFNWPGANKVVAEWFPARERGLAVGIFDSGSSVGGLIAGPLVTFVALRFGWRATFVVTGAMGFFWLIPWLYFYRPLTSHPRLSLDERRLIESGRDTALRSSRQGLDKYLGLLRQSNVWGIVLGRTLTDPIWWFYITWMPQYFGEVRGFNLKQIGFFLPSIFIASDLGNLMGGWVSGRLINRGMPVLAARKWVCVFSAVPMLAVIPGAMTSHRFLALSLICLATWGYASWSTMGLAFPPDLFPQDTVGAVTGLSGLSAGLAGGVVLWVVGLIRDHFHSYLPSLLAAGLIPLLATACVLVLIRSPKAQNLASPSP